jgi:hypothetical protein
MKNPSQEWCLRLNAEFRQERSECAKSAIGTGNCLRSVLETTNDFYLRKPILFGKFKFKKTLMNWKINLMRSYYDLDLFSIEIHKISKKSGEIISLIECTHLLLVSNTTLNINIYLLQKTWRVSSVR